ncbi:type VI secretion system contractile sheath domain-containing protein, partial [Burkholderia ubonensis]
MTCVDPDLLDWCLADLDEQLGRQLDAILHHPAFQALESTWRGLQFLVDRTDFRQNVKIEV